MAQSMKRRRATSYELVFKAMEFQAILKRGGGGGEGSPEIPNYNSNDKILDKREWN